MNTVVIPHRRAIVMMVVAQLLLSAVALTSPASAATPTLVEEVRISGDAGAAMEVTLPTAITVPENYGPNGLFEVVGEKPEGFAGFALLRVTPERGPVGVFAAVLPAAAGSDTWITTVGEHTALQAGRYQLVLMTTEPIELLVHLKGLEPGALSVTPSGDVNFQAKALTERFATDTTYSAGDAFTLTNPAAITFGAHWVVTETHLAGQYSICRNASGLPDAAAYSHACPLGERTDTFRTDTVTDGKFRASVLSLRSGNNDARTQGIGAFSTVAVPYVSAGAVGVWLSIPSF